MAERIIQYQGRYNFSQEEREAREIRIYTGAVKQPSNQYLNFKLLIPRTFYGYAQLCAGELVLETKELQFDGELLYHLKPDVFSVVTEAFYCSTLATLNRSAQEWLQYTALPWTLVAAALYAFFFDQATAYPPLILERQQATHVRFKLYSDALIKVDVRTSPWQACAASANAVFVEPPDSENPPEFPDTPGAAPDPPYTSNDPDTPTPPSGGNGIGNSGFNTGQPYGVPGQPFSITLTVDLPGGACAQAPSGCSSETPCALFPLSFTFTGTGTWIVSPIDRKLFGASPDAGFAYANAGVFSAETATTQLQSISSAGAGDTPPAEPGLSCLNWFFGSLSYTNLVVN